MGNTVARCEEAQEKPEEQPAEQQVDSDQEEVGNGTFCNETLRDFHRHADSVLTSSLNLPLMQQLWPHLVEPLRGPLHICIPRLR